MSLLFSLEAVSIVMLAVFPTYPNEEGRGDHVWHDELTTIPQITYLFNAKEIFSSSKFSV